MTTAGTIDISFLLRPSTDPVASFFGGDEGSPPDAAKYYEMIGRIIALWGRIEMPINLLVSQLYIKELLKDDYKSPPRALTKKIQFLRYVFGEFTEFNPLKPKFDAISTQILRASKERNMLCHHLFWNFQGDDERTMMFVDTERGLKNADRKYLSLADLTKLATTIGYTSTSVLFFQMEFNRLLKTIFQERQQAVAG